MDIPDFFSAEGEEENISVFFMDEDGNVVSPDVKRGVVEDSAYKPTRIEEVAKALNSAIEGVSEKGVTGSKQSEEELNRASIITALPMQGIDGSVVEPPYSVEVMQDFLEIEETHARCCRVKATDSVCRGYTLKNSVPIKLKGTPTEDDNLEERVDRADYLAELKQAKKFLMECNEIVQFEGALELAALDYESCGWGALEVIRGADKRVKKISHIPAGRIKPLLGWKGFVEYSETDPTQAVKYYLPFGKKLYVVSDELLNTTEDYDPEIHDIDSDSVKMRLISYKDGQPTQNFMESANEVIWIKNHHPNSIYYGYSDAIPAVGAIIGNSNIRQYFLQFFQHNTVPRFAIVVEGGKLTGEVMKYIHDYFNSEVKKMRHSTLILSVPSMRGEVKVRFERLDTAQKEGDFLKTTADNRQAIMTAHGVSGAIIGVNDKAELGSGKGLSQAEIYKDRIVIPRQRKWEQAINNLFRRGLGLKYVKIEFNPLDIRDREAEMRILTGYADRGATSINDIRETIGLQPIEGGNRAFVKTRSGSLVFVDTFDNLGEVAPREVPKNDPQNPDGVESNQIESPPNQMENSDGQLGDT